MLQSLRWRNIGNANLIGRISSVDALESDWSHVVVGSASGGVWKSVNGGTSWTTIFDNYGSASIGDVRINQQNPQIIWVGTGEECGRNSAAWGDGIYKSTDGGATFTNVGLKDSYNIAKIVLHPKNQDLVYVAAIGNIYTGGGSRGVFKTHRRRQDLDEADRRPAERPADGRDRSRDGSDQSGDPLHRVLAAHPLSVGAQVGRPAQRHLQVGERRQDVDEADQGPAAWRHGPQRPGDRAQQPARADGARRARQPAELRRRPRWWRRRRRRRTRCRASRGPRSAGDAPGAKPGLRHVQARRGHVSIGGRRRELGLPRSRHQPSVLLHARRDQPARRQVHLQLQHQLPDVARRRQDVAGRRAAAAATATTRCGTTRTTRAATTSAATAV